MSKQIKEQIRFETLAAFVRDVASYDTESATLEEFLERIETAKWIKAFFIDNNPS